MGLDLSQDIHFDSTPKQFRVWDYLHHRWFQGNPSDESRKLLTDSVAYFGEVLTMQGTLFDQNQDHIWRGQVRGSVEVPCYLIVVQSTGLYDKDGRMVFEGDILDFFGEKRYVSFDRVYGDYTQLKKGEKETMTIFNWDSGRIVGNIFENGELLDE